MFSQRQKQVAEGRSFSLLHLPGVQNAKLRIKILKLISVRFQDVTIVVANYDTETALKNKYNITHQTTFVQVDNNGNVVTQWTGSNQGVQDLLDNIKSI